MTDFKEERISNRLICCGYILGLALCIMGDGSAGIVHFLVNISIPVILLFLLFQLRVLGAGDIKLFSMTGGFLSTRQLIYLIGWAFLAASVVGTGKLIHDRKTNGIFWKKRTLIHFSVEILIAYFIVVWGCAIA